ncbi:MAG: flagellar filament capping protein FliD [SAR324 cluster bacterium]|nr:flagellar filament capping protein FliD [SAR324 cluster bacterium]
MQFPLNNTSPTFFPSDSSRTSTSPKVNKARETINQTKEDSSNISQSLFDEIFINKRKVPQLHATGPLATLRTADAISLLTQNFQAQKIPIIDDLENKESFIIARTRQLDDLSDSLKDLEETTTNLLLEGALNPKSVSSSRFREVLAAVGKNAPLDSIEVRTVQLARRAELASNVFDPSAQLNLSGSFSVNGIEVPVASTDSLINIINKINFGEDFNRNGSLDLSEDVNGNGTLEILQLANSEFGSGVFIKEDVNDNGEIDGSEDKNSNDRLDGGTSDHNVLALLRDNRLVLVSLAGGNNTIDLKDDNDVLFELGFFELDSRGAKAQKEIQLNDIERPDNLVVQPQQAMAEVDGKLFRGNSNIVSGAIEDTVLMLRKVSDTASKITIFIDAPTFFAQIKTLFHQFNDSISKLNNLLEGSNTFESDAEIQDIRNELTTETQKRVRIVEERNRIIDDFRGRPGNPRATGVSVANTKKMTQQEVAVTSIVQAIQRGLIFPSQNGDENLLKRLSSLGIRTLTDNTFTIDEEEFARGLEKNTQEVFDLFTNSKTGILPLLSQQLEQIVRDDRGDLVLKKNKLLTQSEAPNALKQNFRKFTENSNLETTVQTLIAVA